MNAPTKQIEGTALADSTALQVMPELGGRDLVLQGHYFDRLERLGNVMSKANGAVPRHLIGNPGACFSVAMVATRANFDPFGVARKTWLGPDGALKYEAQLVIALINASGLLQQRLRWEYFGPWEKILGKFQWRDSKKKEDEHGNPKKYIVKAWNDADEVGLGVRCFATLKGETEPRVTELLMAQAVVRNSTLWVEDPKQQIAYLSGFRWGRLHTPEVIMGVYTREEEFADPVDMGPADVVPTVPPELMERARKAADGGVAAYVAFWKSCTNGERALLCEQTDENEKFKKIATEADAKRTVDNTAGSKPTPAPTVAPTPAPTQPPSDPALPVDGKVTEDSVRAMLEKAGNADAVDIAGDWINEVADQEARGRLQALYEQCRAKFAPQ